MADAALEKTVLADLQREAAAIGQLAANEDAFASAYKAFRAADRDGFQAALTRLKLLPLCELVCEWIRIKECVFLCLELCGPPKPVDQPPDPRFVAEAIVRITADKRLIAELVAIVEKRDSAAFQEFVQSQKLGPFCHFFCHWVCLVRHRLICRWVCGTRTPVKPDLASELAAAGNALRHLLANSDTFTAVVTASEAGDPTRFRAALEPAALLPFCQWICEWLCSWHCVLVCLRICQQFPLPEITDEVGEAFAFAQATASLTGRLPELERLNTALAAGDAEGFGAVVNELKLQRFCLQLCQWLCFLRCRRVCIRVCPPLQCAITDPTGCTGETPDTAGGFLFVPVHGTATGGDFGHYTLDIQQDGDPPIPGVIIYPGGGSTGTVPVLAGELGRINTTALSDGAYTITLTVFPATPGPTTVCTKTFNLLKVAVYIASVAGVTPTPNCFDENAELISGGQTDSFGGALTVAGSAYVYNCSGRKIQRYELRWSRVAAPGPGPGQPPNDTPIPAAWPATQELHNPLVYDPSKYFPWTRVGEAPTNLINDWGTVHFGPPSPGGVDYPVLVPGSWDTRAQGTGATGGARLAVLLVVEDTAGHRYFDLQRIWVDNWPVLCEIVKFQKPAAGGGWEDIPHCTDILLSWGKLRIIGLAWDSLIDSAWPTAHPNDNFASYALSYQKEFSPVASPIPISPTPDFPTLSATQRVPAALSPTPTTADASLLAEWDLSTLDAGAAPPPGCSAPLPAGKDNDLYRGCSCTYTLSLGVSDTTLTETAFDLDLHHPSTSEPIKIVNDL